MTQLTPVYSFPWPEETDPPDGSSQIHALALAVEGELVSQLAPLVSASGAQKTPTVFTSNGSIAASLYPSAKALQFVVTSGGGGGGSAPTTPNPGSSAGGGGQGGQTILATIAVSSLVFPLQITVGAGGAGGVGGGSPANGSIGGTSSVIGNGGAGTTYISVTGGNGGASNAAATGLGGTAFGGQGGPVTTVPAAGVVVTGTTGATGLRFAPNGAVLSGRGGASYLGGGAMDITGGAGNNAIGIGGGGGGAALATVSTAGLSGGAGSTGAIIVIPLY